MNQDLEIQVDISNYILTPLSCASLVENFLKGLLYQKNQLPYPFTWLKSSINRRRNRPKEEDEVKVQVTGSDIFKVENNYRIASRLYDGLEGVMKEFANELSRNTVSEFYIIFGPTPLCPKEVCRIKIPPLAMGHFEQVHVQRALKLQHNALRQIFLSDCWMDSVDCTIPCTNIFIFMTKCEDSGTHMLFKPCNPINFHKNVKQYTINVNWDSSLDGSCCKIFDENDGICEESSNPTDDMCQESPDSTDKTKANKLWYQFSDTLQGYTNFFINGRGACEYW